MKDDRSSNHAEGFFIAILPACTCNRQSSVQTNRGGGPSQVASSAYRANYDTIFGRAPVGQS